MKTMPEKVIVVSGGAGGIGSAIVKKLANAERTVVVVADIAGDGTKSDNIYYRKLDVTNVVSMLLFCNWLMDKFGFITDFVSLAGGALPKHWQGTSSGEWGGLEDTDTATIAESVNLNLTSHITFTKNLIPLFKKAKGKDKSITFIASINALRDYWLPAYSAAKAGLINLAQTLAVDLGRRYDIRVNTICPGTVPTPRTLTEPKNFGKLLKGTAAKRFATPADIAATVAYIMECRGITGSTIVVDGGQEAVSPYSLEPKGWGKDCAKAWRTQKCQI